MRGRIVLALAVLAALAGAAQAEPTRAGADKSCVKQLHHDETSLPAASRQARSTLIANPSRIETVAAHAARAGEQQRAEIELGILRAAEWLQCVDPAGYRPIADYLSQHASDPVVADLNKALNAEASAGNGVARGTTTNAAGAGANAGGGGAGNSPGSVTLPSFAAAGPVISPSR